jgi:hypothetical protein
MQLSGAALIKQFWTVSQRSLFPVLEEDLGPLSERHKLLASAFTLLELEGMGMRRGRGRGRPPADRLAILRAFLAKSCLNLSTTRQLLDLLQSDATLRRLCGWQNWRQVPSEAVFSRAFAELASSGWLEQVQKELVERVYGGRLVGHVIRDATAIEVREKPERKSPAAAPPKRHRGRPRKDEPPAPKPRLERQPEMSLPEMLAELPTACDRGCKMGTDGRKHRWKGYKLHGDVSDSQVPLSGVLTSASTHDSQVAIPLATMTAQRVTACYELMDAGYHSERIQAYSEGLGHVVLIPDVERQGKEAMPMAPAQKQRYGLRTLIERMTGRLKDEFGGGHIRVRGHRKVMAHLMLGVLMLAVDQVLRLAS